MACASTSLLCKQARRLLSTFILLEASAQSTQLHAFSPQASLHFKLPELKRDCLAGFFCYALWSSQDVSKLRTLLQQHALCDAGLNIDGASFGPSKSLSAKSEEHISDRGNLAQKLHMIYQTRWQAVSSCR